MVYICNNKLQISGKILFSSKHYINIISAAAAAIPGCLFVSGNITGGYRIAVALLYLVLYFIIVTGSDRLAAIKKPAMTFRLKLIMFAAASALFISVCMIMAFTTRIRVYLFPEKFIPPIIVILFVAGLLVFSSSTFRQMIIRIIILFLIPQTYGFVFGFSEAFPVFVLVIPVCIFLLYQYRMNTVIAGAAIIALIAAVILIHLGAGDLIGVFSALPFAVLIIYAGWSVSTFNEVIFSSGLLMGLYLFAGTLSGLDYGITAYNIALPFFILSLQEYQVDKFLGRKYSNSEF